MSTSSSSDAKTDGKSFQEMIEGIAALRPRSQVRHLPRFPTAVALAGQLGKREHDGLLVREGPGTTVDGNLPEPEIQESGFPKGFHIVDFSERGFQLQFRCDGLKHLLNQSLALDIQATRIPVAFSWCKQSPPIGRGGVSFAEDSGGRSALMDLVAKMGEDLVHFLVKGFKEGWVSHTEQAAVFSFFAIFYALRLQFLQNLASVWELAQGVNDRPGSIKEIEESIVASSGFSKGRWEIGEGRDLGLDPISAVFMKPFHEYGCALIGLHEDSLFLEDDALAVVKQSILLPRERRMEKVRILPRFRLLYQSLLDLRGLFPGIFQDVQFDFQFGYYCALINRLEALGEELVYKAYENDPFQAYSPREDASHNAGSLGVLGHETARAVGNEREQKRGVAPSRVSDKEVRVFTHSGKPVTITCPECSNLMTLAGEQTAGMGGSRRVKCSCGVVFKAFFERRRSYRKAVSLYGKWKPEVALEYRPMVVKDLSRGGLSFELLAEDHGPAKDTGTVAIADTLHVEFRLDDEKRSLIRGKVDVRSLNRAFVKAEFTLLDNQANKDLGFYFL